MTRTIRQTFRHVARHEKRIQDPIRTIALGSGSCRDLAVLMIAALRSRGIAARFVSGYIHLAEEGTKKTSIQLRVATPTLGSRLTFQVLAGSISIRRRVL